MTIRKIQNSFRPLELNYMLEIPNSNIGSNRPPIILKSDADVYASTLVGEIFEDTVWELNPAGKAVLDVGCGEGNIAITAALRGASVTAVDLNENAVKTTRDNAIRNGVNVHALVSDGFSAIGNGRFDLIVANCCQMPQHLSSEQNAPIRDDGESGLKFLNDVIRQAHGYLKPGGKLLVWTFSLADMEGTKRLIREHWDIIKVIDTFEYCVRSLDGINHYPAIGNYGDRARAGQVTDVNDRIFVRGELYLLENQQRT